jgi:hypothetical protein
MDGKQVNGKNDPDGKIGCKEVIHRICVHWKCFLIILNRPVEGS